MGDQPEVSALDLSFKELERFVAVVERGGLAEASKTLGITQQALGRSLTKLEGILGAKLLHRAQGSQTKPTLYGEAFLQYAKSQLNGIAQAVQHVQALAGARSGSVALGIGETCDITALSRAVRDFHKSQPDVEISLIEDYTQPLLDLLIEGELDCVVGAIPDAPYARRGVSHETLYSIDDIVVARAEHPVHRKRRPTLKDLQGYTWLVARRRTGDWAAVRDAFLAEGLDPPQHLIRTDAAMLGTQLLLDDDFLLMVSPTMVQSSERSPALRQVPVATPGVTRHAGLMTMEKRELTPATLALMNLIRQRAGELRH